MMSGAWPPPAPSVWYMWMVRPLDRREGVFEEAALVQRVGMQLHLEIELVGDRQTRVDHRGHRAPVLVNLQPEAPAFHLVDERARACDELPRPRKPKLIGHCFGGLQHLADVEVAAAIDADGDGAERAADHRGEPGG